MKLLQTLGRGERILHVEGTRDGTMVVSNMVPNDPGIHTPV